MFLATEFSGTIGYFPLMGMLPEGVMRLAVHIAATMSSGEGYKSAGDRV